MASLALMTTIGFAIRPDWLRADGVVAPELAATWCSLTIRVNNEFVTTVDDARGGGLRRQIYVSAYPLAEWIAQHWWALRDHLRPSGEPSSSWRWRVNRPAWLDSHNLRAAGDGMSWPDLAILPEGATTRLSWRAAPGLADQPVTFLTAGDVLLPSEDVKLGLVGFLRTVLGRLDEHGVSDTPLQDEWAALGALDGSEIQFATAAARLGLNPFDVPEDIEKRLVDLADRYDSELWSEFLDTADPRRLEIADRWLSAARDRVPSAVEKIPVVDRVRNPTSPWGWGYEVARRLRESLGMTPTEAFPVSDYVGVLTSAGDAGGLQGYVGARSGFLGLVLPGDTHPRNPTTTSRFAQGRALGLAVCMQRDSALLDSAGTVSAKVSRAFAAELLAPAQGITECLAVLGPDSEAALEAVASRFQVSPMVVNHQYENQLV